MRLAPEALVRIKKALLEIYGDRLKGVVIYGSEARGEAREDSDIDLLVLLNGPVNLVADLKMIIDALYPIVLDILIPIHGFPVEFDAYETGEYALYRNARKEGVLI